MIDLSGIDFVVPTHLMVKMHHKSAAENVVSAKTFATRGSGLVKRGSRRRMRSRESPMGMIAASKAGICRVQQKYSRLRSVVKREKDLAGPKEGGAGPRYSPSLKVSSICTFPSSHLIIRVETRPRSVMHCKNLVRRRSGLARQRMELCTLFQTRRCRK